MESSTNTLKTSGKTNSFFSGVFILTISNLLVKIIGLFFKIPISHILGDEGMGYFNAAYTIYTWLYILSTAGFPVAISILVSKALARKSFNDAQKIGKISLYVLLLSGLMLSSVTMLFSSSIAKVIGSSEASFAIMMITPTLFFVCVSSALRGYYQGYGFMQQTAYSQIFEAVGKLAIGVLLALYAQRQGYNLSTIAGFAILGVTIGSLLSMLYLLFFKPKRCREEGEHNFLGGSSSASALLISLFKIAAPITLGATVMSLTNVIDLGMIMRRLQSIGLSVAQATALYGNYTTLVVPMFNLPSVFVYSIAYAIVPIISAACAQNDKKTSLKCIQSSIVYTSLVAMPCALGIGVFSYPILSVVFQENSASVAAPYLSVIAPGIVFICLLTVTNSILQSYGYSKLPIISLLVGSLIKILISYFLIGNKTIGMYGAPIGTVLCYFIASFTNLVFIKRKTKLNLDFQQTLMKPFCCAGIAVGIAYGVFRTLEEFAVHLFIRLAVAIITSAVVYILLAFKMKLINKSDVLRLPVVDKIIGIAHIRNKKRIFENGNKW